MSVFAGRVRARKYKDAERRRDTAEQRADRDFALREQSIADSSQRANRQLGLQARSADAARRRADRDFALRERKAAEGSRIARAAEERAIRDEQRKDEAFRLEKGALSRRESLQRESQMMSSLGSAYQLAAFGNEDQALAMLNRGLPMNKMADSIAVDDNGDFLIGRRGVVDRVPLARIRRFIPRDPMEGVSRPSTKPSKMAAAKEFLEFGKKYDLLTAKTDVKNAIKAGLAEGQDWDVIAQTFELQLTPAAEAKAEETRAAQAQAEGLREEIDRIRRKQEVGDYRTAWGKKRDAAKMDQLMKQLNGLAEKHEVGLEAGGGQRDTVVTGNGGAGRGRIVTPKGTLTVEELQAEDRRGTGLIRTDEGTMTVKEARRGGQGLIRADEAYDTNADGRVDELDRDYADALRAVELASVSPQNREAIVARFGARRVAEMEALVKAVQKQIAAEAEARVGGSRQPAIPGNIPGTGPFSLDVL